MIRKIFFQKTLAFLLIFLLLIPIQAPAMFYIGEQKLNNISFDEEWNSDRFQLRLKRRIGKSSDPIKIICKCVDQNIQQQFVDRIYFSLEFYSENWFQELFSVYIWYQMSVSTFEAPPPGEQVNISGPSGVGFSITNIKAEAFNENGSAKYKLKSILILGPIYIARNLDFVAVDTNETI